MTKTPPPKFFQTKLDVGAYEYRGFHIWHNVAPTKPVWVVNGNRGGEFRTLREAKSHVDRIIKYGKPKAVKPQQK